MNTDPSATTRVVLFDLDGTLIDTAPDMARALNDVLIEDGGSALPYEAIRPHVSKGANGLLDLAYGASRAPAERDPLRQRFLERYRADLATESRLFPGMETLLADLESAAMRWGVVTNKPGWLAEPLLATLELDARCACLVCGDTLDRRKPDPAPLYFACERLGVSTAEAMYVGDDERDIAAGRAAAMRTIVALFGYLGTGDHPRHWGPDGLIETPGELWAHLARAPASVG